MNLWGGAKQLKFHGGTTLGTGWEKLILQKSYFMGQAMGGMENSVNPGLRDSGIC